MVNNKQKFILLSKLKEKFTNLFCKEKYIISYKKEKWCPVCEKKSYFLFPDKWFFQNWQKNQFQYSIFCFETFNVSEHLCCNCNASDRCRLIALYLKKFFVFRKTEYSLLEIGYSPTTFNIVKSLNKGRKIIYYILDKYYTKADFKSDVQNCKDIKDEYFDIIICSHVLEHVANPEMAVTEIYRILKRGGIVFFLAPILLNIEKTIENNNFNTSELRWKYYGQEDHLRIFSKKDFIDLLNSVQFKIKQLDVNYFGSDLFKKCGIDEKSILYVCEKI